MPYTRTDVIVTVFVTVYVTVSVVIVSSVFVHVSDVCDYLSSVSWVNRQLPLAPMC